MTQKFIPFDPNTAKNGDVLHYANHPEWTYVYIGPCTDKNNASVVFNPRNNTYGFNYNDSMVVPQPMKTIWINVYDYNYKNKHEVYAHDSKEKALENLDKNRYYRGTYPLQIDDVA